MARGVAGFLDVQLQGNRGREWEYWAWVRENVGGAMVQKR